MEFTLHYRPWICPVGDNAPSVCQSGFRVSVIVCFYTSILDPGGGGVFGKTVRVSGCTGLHEDWDHRSARPNARPNARPCGLY